MIFTAGFFKPKRAEMKNAIVNKTAHEKRNYVKSSTPKQCEELFEMINYFTLFSMLTPIE